MNILYMCIFASFLSIFLMLVSYFFSYKYNHNMEKLSSFECGFISFIKLRKSFSLRFFLISLIFIIFDIEIIFLLPLSFYQLSFFTNMFSILILTLIIIYGLFHEWFTGSLSWII